MTSTDVDSKKTYIYIKLTIYIYWYSRLVKFKAKENSRVSSRMHESNMQRSRCNEIGCATWDCNQLYNIRLMLDIGFNSGESSVEDQP